MRYPAFLSSSTLKFLALSGIVLCLYPDTISNPFLGKVRRFHVEFSFFFFSTHLRSMTKSKATLSDIVLASRWRTTTDFNSSLVYLNHRLWIKKHCIKEVIMKAYTGWNKTLVPCMWVGTTLPDWSVVCDRREEGESSAGENFIQQKKR